MYQLLFFKKKFFELFLKKRWPKNRLLNPCAIYNIVTINNWKKIIKLLKIKAKKNCICYGVNTNNMYRNSFTGGEKRETKCNGSSQTSNTHYLIVSRQKLFDLKNTTKKRRLTLREEAVDQFPSQMIVLKNILQGREISTKKTERRPQLDLYDGSSELTSTTKLLFFFQ